MNVELLDLINDEMIKKDIPPECQKRTKIVLEKLKEVVVNDSELKNRSHIVIGLCGGSGSGKTVMADSLGYTLNKAGIKTLIMTGDNVPRRIPLYNDAERVTVFRNAGNEALLSRNLYNSDVRQKLKKWMSDFTDASYSYVEENPWFKFYLDAGKSALENYLGQPAEQDFDYCNKILQEFHAGKSQVWVRNLGREEDSLCYEEQDFSDTEIMILEWTHSNSDFVKGVDIPIFLESTVEETLKYRLLRNRDTHIDSPFLTMVLTIEQNMLIDQSHKAKIKVGREA